MSDDAKRPPDAATRTLAGPRTVAFPKVRLKVLKGPDKGKTVTLVEDEILIGGADSAQLRLTDPTVSRNHCVIRMTAKGPLLRDLGSTNGSRIEGVEVREAVRAARRDAGARAHAGPLRCARRISRAAARRLGALRPAVGAVDGDAAPVRARRTRRRLRRHRADRRRDRHRQGRAVRGDPPGAARARPAR